MSADERLADDAESITRYGPVATTLSRVQGSHFSDVISSAALRIALFPLSGLASLLVARIVTDAIGRPGFALYALLLTLPTLLPFSDFGLSAAVTDTVSQEGVQSPRFRAVWDKSWFLLASLAIVILTVAAAVSLFGGWSTILGLPDSASLEWAAFLMVGSLAFSLPMAVSQRLLLGVGRQRLVTTVQTVTPMGTLGLVLLVTAFKPTLPLFTAAAAASQVLAGLASTFLAVRELHQRGAPAMPRLPRRSGGKGVRLGRIALPMAIISTALPLAYQSDRILLAHLGTTPTSDIANYSVVSLVYVPLFSIVGFGGQALWPLFLRHATRPEQQRGLYVRATFGACVAAIGLGTVLLLVGPLAAKFVTNEAESIQRGLYGSFAVLLVLLTVCYPAGMLLMDAAGRKLQGILAVIMVAGKLLLSVILVPRLGASGAVWSTAIAVAVIMVVPLLVVGDLRTRRRNLGTAANG